MISQVNQQTLEKHFSKNWTAFTHNFWTPFLDFQPCSKLSAPWWSSASSLEPLAAWWPCSPSSVWKWETWRIRWRPRWRWPPGSSSCSQVPPSCQKTPLEMTGVELTVSPLWRSGACGIAGVSAFANLIVRSFRFVTYTDEGFGVVGGLTVAGLMGAPPPRYHRTTTIPTFSFRCVTFVLLHSSDSLQVHVWPCPFCGMDRWSHVGRRWCNDVLGMPCNGTGTKATVSLQLSYVNTYAFFC